MSKRQWTDRVRDIEGRNPGGHSAAARVTPNPDPAWDRVVWQTEGDGDFSAHAAARPILVALKWLAGRGLLSPRGLSTLGAPDTDMGALALERSMVSPSALAFLDQSYLSWQTSHGFNLIIDESMPSESAVAELDRLWDEHSRKAG